MFRYPAALALAAALASLACAGPALAHAHLKAEDPAANATVTAPPSALTLTFSEGLEVKFTRVSVTGPGKAAVPTGALTLDPANPTVLTVPFANPLAPGKYQVDWHATATDTHKTQGTYSFTVKP